MARRKNHPETVRVKCHLAERLREIRTELYGDRGGSEMARQLGVPIRTWYNYESGVTVPAEVLLRFMELTSVEPMWLLHGEGAKFRSRQAVPAPIIGSTSVESLLRTALQQLERQGNGSATPATPVAVNPVAAPGAPVANGHAVPPTDAQRGWHEAESQGRCVEVCDDAMMPILAMGARVAYSGTEEPHESLEGALVVAWAHEKPLVRWFRRSGSYGLLRAENPEYSPGILLLDLKAPQEERRLRRVLWTSTPH